MAAMQSDPPIDEIREIRGQISARFDHDPVRLFEHFRELQKQYEGRLFRGEPLRDAKTPSRLKSAV